MALSYAILVALNDQACSGYDLTKRFKESIGNFWQASHQQIYKELSKLESKDLIKSQLIQQSSRPNKKEYKITKKGISHLKKWLLEPSKDIKIKDEFLLKFFAGHLIPKSILKEELTRQYKFHIKKLNEYKKVANEFKVLKILPSKYKMQYLTLKQGILYEESWLEWYQEAVKILKLE